MGSNSEIQRYNLYPILHFHIKYTGDIILQSVFLSPIDSSFSFKMDYAECVYSQNNIDIKNNNIPYFWSKIL